VPFAQAGFPAARNAEGEKALDTVRVMGAFLQRRLRSEAQGKPAAAAKWEG
jgi:hypothetical protein